MFPQSNIHKMLLFTLFLLLAVPLHALPVGKWWAKEWLQNPLSLNLLTKTSTPDEDLPLDAALEDFLAFQYNVSLAQILENIGGASTTLDPKEVARGVVVASQLRLHPNYFYTWTRDSALTIRTLIYQMIDSPADVPKMKRIIEDYIEVNRDIQKVPNLSGTFDDEGRRGLGEPKYMPNGKAFNEPWGRPQSDGPALRILTIVNYLNALEKIGEKVDSSKLKDGKTMYQDIVRYDLEYVIANWKVQLFDLWEEIKSIHFFNALVQLRGLGDGYALAKASGETAEFLGEIEAAFNDLRAYITDLATGFVSYAAPYIVETPSLVREGRRTGLDAASLLAALHGHNMEFGNTENVPFDVDDSHVLNTIISMVADMKFRYPVNRNFVSRTLGVGLGRYQEDIYDGYETSEGNPWFICTASAAEVLYKFIYKKLDSKLDIVISPATREFYLLFVDDLFADTDVVLTYGSPRYMTTLENIFQYADLFLKVILQHVDRTNGKMLEQFNKYTGFMQGAEQLTWSYSSFFNSVRWRNKAADAQGQVKSTTF